MIKNFSSNESKNKKTDIWIKKSDIMKLNKK